MKAVAESPVAHSSRRFVDDGFQILENVLSQSDCDVLAMELTVLFEKQQCASRRTIGGVRNVQHVSSRVADIARSSKFAALIDNLTGEKMFPVKATLFDKTSQANWNVPWHQDLTIPVAGRIDSPGFGPWSVKDGVVHVQPPVHILGTMAAIRLHLDDSCAENGALRVIPGSHLHGELGAEEIMRWTTRHNPVVCEIPRGGVLLMRPLLLHASSAARQPSHRRVLHVEYSARDLPNGLKWSDWS